MDFGFGINWISVYQYIDIQLPTGSKSQLKNQRELNSQAECIKTDMSFLLDMSTLYKPGYKNFHPIIALEIFKNKS